jgi:hypothetical protein
VLTVDGDVVVVMVSLCGWQAVGCQQASGRGTGEGGVGEHDPFAPALAVRTLLAVIPADEGVLEPQVGQHADGAEPGNLQGRADGDLPGTGPPKAQRLMRPGGAQPCHRFQHEP